MNHYDTLNVRHGANADEIQEAFRKAAFENHPDLNASPEAAEAFMRIKEARDALMKDESRVELQQNSDAIRRATDDAVRATTNAAYAQTPQASRAHLVDDLYAGMSAEEIAYIQELDRLAQQHRKRGLFRAKETDEVRRHRKKLQTGKNRIIGKY